MRTTFVASAFAIFIALAAASEDPRRLALEAPIKTWDEAVPLGNGRLGGLLWGEGNLLKVSLDRGDLWDLRTPPVLREKGFTFRNLEKLVQEGNQKEISRLFDDPYNYPTPTKIPAGRLEIVIGGDARVGSFELNMVEAEGLADFGQNRQCRAFFDATRPVALLQLRNLSPVEIRLRAPGSGGGETGPSSQAVASLGYPPAEYGAELDTWWMRQRTAEGWEYVVLAAARREGTSTLLAITVATSKEDRDPLALARKLTRASLAKGYAKTFRQHAEWWSRFWAQSGVTLPDSAIARQYHLVRYLYGSGSRRAAPPLPLQGVWTADAGQLPPWKGDYHNDLNTQMTYMGYLAAGHFDEGRSFLDFNYALLPAYRRFAREFYGTPGANIPGVMALDGQPLTGWPQYSLSPTMGPWVAHIFYLHWRYTADRRFLRQRAYPFCSAIGESVRALLRADESGTLKLPLSSSPEIHDNRLSAWLPPNSNYDLFCLKMLFLSLSEMAHALDRRTEATAWKAVADRLGSWHVSENHALLLNATEPLRESHRHLSNLMGLYPFNLVSVEGGEPNRETIGASLQRWDELGTAQWCGYSFSWMSALRARVGDPEPALRNLEIFTKAFLLRNGFHANGDQTRSGFSSMTYRPFTLEGNMLAAAAVHEMLLQSWSPEPGRPETEIIRIFPAVSEKWQNVAFSNLRAEGGHKVSAERVQGRTKWFKIEAGKTGLLRLADTFMDAHIDWNRSGVSKHGSVYEVKLHKGQTLEGRVNAYGPDGHVSLRTR